MEILKIKGKAFQVFDIIKRLDEKHGSMTIAEYDKKINGGGK
jgi:hypothetical protein